VEASYAILHHSTAPQFSEISQVKLLKTKVRSKLSLVQPWIILALSVAMIVLAVFFDLLFAFAGVVGIVAVCIRLITWRQALESIQGSLLLLIACSFALAIALERTGVASNIARGLAFIFRPGGAYTQLMGIFLATSLLTNVISNAAAASVMYPIVVSLCKDTGLSLKVRLLSYFFFFVETKKRLLCLLLCVRRRLRSSHRLVIKQTCLCSAQEVILGGIFFILGVHCQFFVCW